MKSETFDSQCQRCPRLVEHLESVRKSFPDYHAAPVPAFGSTRPELLIVGLAPGMHGANATGRPFTGDYAGILLYKALHRYGFSNRAKAVSRDDGLRLSRCRITNAVKCLPPENKPIGAEVNQCNAYLRAEIAALRGRFVILALGNLAHRAVVKALGGRQSEFRFAHGALHELGNNRYLLDSYHCSRYNTQTRRLSEEMFFAIFDKIVEINSLNN